MGHGTPVHPGTGVDNCGSAGAYFLDTICSAYYTAQFWGLTGGGTTPPPTSAPPTTTPPAGVCVTASNFAHTSAGRAHQVSGKAFANGSNQDMGLWNVFVTHTLRRTGPNFWVLADGGC